VKLKAIRQKTFTIAFVSIFFDLTTQIYHMVKAALWKNATKSQLGRGKAGVSFYLVAEVGMVVVAAFKGDLQQAFLRVVVFYFAESGLVTHQVDKFFRTDSHLLVKGPLQLPGSGKVLFGQHLNTQLAF
jgi:hypothetical protein